MVAAAAEGEAPEKGAVLSAGEDETRRRQEVIELLHETARVRVPEQHLGVIAGGGEEAAVGRELARDHVVRVADETVHNGVRVDVPHERLAVGADRAERRVGRRPVDGVHLADVAGERLVHVAVVDNVPELDEAVVRGRGETQRAVLAEAQAADGVVVVEEDEEELLLEHVVDAYAAGHGADGEYETVVARVEARVHLGLGDGAATATRARRRRRAEREREHLLAAVDLGQITRDCMLLLLCVVGIGVSVGVGNVRHLHDIVAFARPRQKAGIRRQCTRAYLTREVVWCVC